VGLGEIGISFSRKIKMRISMVGKIEGIKVDDRWVM
jgi:hypothetical protein